MAALKGCCKVVLLIVKEPEGFEFPALFFWGTALSVVDKR